MLTRARVSSLLVFLIFTAVGWLNLLFTTAASADELVDTGNESFTPALELLQAEVLDTVSLEQPVHFTTPDAIDTVASPETYRVLAFAQNQLKLVSLTRKHVLVVDALSMNHHEDVGLPIALYVRDDEKFPHVVLLLPGGKGLEAVGSYDAARARGTRSVRLTPIQIKDTLMKKMQQKEK